MAKKENDKGVKKLEIEGKKPEKKEKGRAK